MLGKIFQKIANSWYTTPKWRISNLEWYRFIAPPENLLLMWLKLKKLSKILKFTISFSTYKTVSFHHWPHYMHFRLPDKNISQDIFNKKSHCIGNITTIFLSIT